tara:strand:- start:195 stop:512 length:318 start_codon:yes stop_codon:yes gene_type:complete
LASGDVFADMATGGTYDVRPAVGVQCMITHVMADATTAKFYPKGAGGTLTSCYWQTNSADGAFSYGQSSNTIANTMGSSPMKFFITNTEYMRLSGTNTGYTGIEL